MTYWNNKCEIFGVVIWKNTFKYRVHVVAFDMKSTKKLMDEI